MRLASVVLLLALVLPSGAQDNYGAKGIFPVYETDGQWVIFDKNPSQKTPAPLGKGGRFLVIGNAGAQLFKIGRQSGTYGGGCRGHKPLKLRAGLLVGPRRDVGRPIIGIHVPETFTLKGSKAAYASLKNEVSEATYQTLGEALRAAGVEDAKAQDPKPEMVQNKIDFGASLAVAGLGKAFIFVEETMIGASTRRCLRLAVGDKLIGDCAEMPRALMAETPLLQFVSYDPSGAGNPFLLALTKTTPLWGDERWGFAIRAGGPRLFLMDAMDIRCRENF